MKSDDLPSGPPAPTCSYLSDTAPMTPATCPDTSYLPSIQTQHNTLTGALLPGIQAQHSHLRWAGPDGFRAEMNS